MVMRKLLFVGNLTLDDIVHADGRVQMGVGGGNGLFSAIGARMWGYDVSLVGVVGNDWPAEYTQTIRTHGIDTRYLRSVDSENLRAWVLYENDGRRTYVARNSELVALRPNVYDDATLVPASLERFGQMVRELHLRMSPTPDLVTDMNADAIHICPMRFETMSAWSSHLSQYPRLFTTADMFPISLQEKINRSGLISFLSGLDIFLPSISEAKLLQAGDGDLLSLCRELVAYGPDAIVIKDGARGAYVYERGNNQLQHVPAFSASLIDSTGAGDAFCGGYLAGISSTGDPFQAALWGTVSASFIVEAYGGLHGLTVMPENANERLESLKKMI